VGDDNQHLNTNSIILISNDIQHKFSFDQVGRRTRGERVSPSDCLQEVRKQFGSELCGAGTAKRHNRCMVNAVHQSVG
jgi:hypothetical protein